MDAEPTNYTRAHMRTYMCAMWHVYTSPRGDIIVPATSTATSAGDVKMIFFKILEIQNKFRKILEKSLKIRTFTNFKIQPQINPNLFFGSSTLVS